MIEAVLLYLGSIARRKVAAEISLLWSMRTSRSSFLLTAASIQLPRSGMMRKPCSLRSPSCCSVTKSTPGDRWSWLTMTRSAPLMMN
jgi:hypothetical protein